MTGGTILVCPDETVPRGWIRELDADGKTVREVPIALAADMAKAASVVVLNPFDHERLAAHATERGHPPRYITRPH